MKKAYGTYEIADICHVSPPTVGRWMEGGKLPFFTTGGGHRRVSQEDLVTFVEKHNIPADGILNSGSVKTILIVEDETDMRRMIKRAILKKYPHALIEEAKDGFEAGRQIERLDPTLVILDLHLPGLDGFKVCRQIREKSSLKRAKILAISGYNTQVNPSEALRCGANDFLAKPFSVSELLSRVWAMFEPNNSNKRRAAA